MQWCPQYRRWTLGVLTWTLALAWGLPQVADAQPTMSETMSGKKREHLELLRMWRLVDKLEIDEEQAMSVFPAFHRQRTERETLEKRRRSLLAVVTRQLKEEVGDDDLLASIHKVHAVEDDIKRSEAAFSKELANLFSTRQQARLLLFDSTFRTDLMEVVRRMRGAGFDGRPGREAVPGHGDVMGRGGMPGRGGGRSKLWSQ